MTPLVRIAGLYAILDLPHPSNLPPGDIAEALIHGGASVLQVRAKGASSERRADWTREIAEVCLVRGIPLILNDDLELLDAAIPGVVGVHLGQGDLARLGPDLQSRQRRREQLRERGVALGVSTHSLAQVGEALESLTPDYLGFGPVFPTRTKLDTEPVVGLDMLVRAQILAARVATPVVAIGGIDHARANELGGTGVAAIAAIGALTGASPGEIADRTALMVDAFGSMKR